MMFKKIIASVALVATVAVSAAMFAAFEAHVINVTAKIENALTVDTTPIEFGTVFPQEYLKEDLQIALSGSFLSENRVDDVVYVIKQKPKPKHEADRELSIIKPDYNMYLPGGQFEGQLYPNWIDDDYQRANYCHTHEPANADDPDDLYYINCYPNLCSYLSKHKNENDNVMLTDNAPYDVEVDAFHDPNDPANYAKGYLVQSTDDNVDNWVIDLAVPTFAGMSDQGYADWVTGINPDVVNPMEWVLPAGLESKVFGCDLWIEITGISLNTNTCSDGLDNDSDGYTDYPDDPDCLNPFDGEDFYDGPS